MICGGEPVRSTEIPQADSIDTIRRVVSAISMGMSEPSDIGEYLGLSPRHVAYYLQGARTLDWLDHEDGVWRTTSRGTHLLATEPGSEAEISQIQDAIRSSDALRAIGVDLLSPVHISEKALAKRIHDATGLAPATARRRAKTLSAWRRRAIQRNLFASPHEFEGRLLMRDRPATVAIPRPTITHVRLEKFKNFEDASLTIGNLTLIVGTNASGKSNIRDAFRFLHGISRGYTLSEIIGEKWIEGGVLQWKGLRGGTREVAFRKSRSFGLEVGFLVPDGDKSREGTYRIEVDVSAASGPRVVRERLFVAGRGQFVFDSHPDKNAPSQDDTQHLTVRLRKRPAAGFVGPALSTISSRPAITQLFESPEVDVDIKSHIAVALAALRSMRFLDLSPDAMRLPSLPGQTILGDRGENLSSVLMSICQEPRRKRGLIEWIRELTPMDARDFRFPSDPTGKVLVTLVEENGQQTSAHSASDGTLRFLAMIAAFLGPDPANFYFFEELDNGIHPTRLHLLLQLIEQQTARQGRQVMATTHSPQLLAYLSADSLKSATLVYRPKEQVSAQIKRIVDIPTIMRVLRKQDLARLHATGWLENAVDLTTDEIAS